jgi:uncharacterized protein
MNSKAKEVPVTGEKSGVVCKVVGLLVGIGALNWGLVAFFGLDLVAKTLGPMTTASKVVYGLIGLAGVAKLISLVKSCACCKTDSSCGTKK